MLITIKNNNFFQVDYADLGKIDPTIYIIYYSASPSDGLQIFGGICTDMVWGDGREDPLHTNFLVLKEAHKLSEQKNWIEVNPYGRISTETKLDINEIMREAKNTTEEFKKWNNPMEVQNERDEYVYPLIFTPKDPEISLDTALSLWLSTE